MVLLRGERHSSDGELIGLLDGETDTIGADVAAHVDTCAACSARLALFQQRAERLSQALYVTEPPAAARARLVPAPDRVERARHRARRRAIWAHPGLRAAAAILLVAGVAASPARAWILDRVTGRHAEPAPSRPAAAGRAPARAPAQATGSIVWFVAVSDELLIRFDARPAGGTLAVVAGEDSRSSAQIVSRGRGEAFLVLPSELRIRNAPGSVADYEVTLAPAVRRARVRLGDGDAREALILDVTPGMRRMIQLGSVERRK